MVGTLVRRTRINGLGHLPPHSAVTPTFAAAEQPHTGSESQPKSGPREVTRNLTLDFATSTWTGHRACHPPARSTRQRSPSLSTCRGGQPTPLPAGPHR